MKEIVSLKNERINLYIYRAFILSFPRARQICYINNLYPATHTVTGAVLRKTTKEILALIGRSKQP